MSKRLFLLFVGVLSVGLIVAGCGSSDDDSTTTASSLTKAQFIKQANAICEKAGTEIEGETKAYAEENDIDLNKEPTDEQKEELVIDVIVPNVEGQAEKIGALGAPSGEEDQVNEIVEGIETAAAETAEDPSSVITGGAGPFDEVNELAKNYGLTTCGAG